MRRHLPRLLLTGALLSPTTLYALGLGEIRLHSALNQPFDAEIELISPTPEELTSLSVGLASRELFERYGLDRPAYLGNFDFSIRRTRDGRAAIKVTSNRSVTEPFVTLLVEASWARGRLLREYTVLLDPPVFMPSQSQPSAPVATPQSGAPSEGRIERPVEPRPEAAPVSAPAPAAAEPPAAEPASAPVEPMRAASPEPSIAGEYTVQRNDTLWRIASQVNPGSPSTVNRTMIALFRANPGAFDDNINRLRAGSVLRIPDLAEIEAISHAEANAEVARQSAEWSGSLESAGHEESSRLRLVAPEETPEAPAPVAPDRDSAEAPASASGAGIASPEDGRLALDSSELGAAQQAVAEAPVEPAAAAPAEGRAAQAEAQSAEAPTERAPAASRPVQKPAAAPEAGPSLAERVGQFWWLFVVAGLLLVIGLVIAVVRRRREADSAAALDSLDQRFEPAYEPEPVAARVGGRSQPKSDDLLAEFGAREPARTTRESDEFPALETSQRTAVEPALAFEVGAAEAAAASAAHTSADDTLSSESAVRFDQQDALAEADFHMAYGLYDQAADLVKIAIEREPQRRDLRLKLLEIYFVWGNKELFLDTARELHATRGEASASEWDKVLIMGKQIAPEEEMFQGGASAGMDLVDVNLEGGENRVDVDLFAEPEADKPAGLDLEFASGERPGLSAGDDRSESDLDFLLDEPQGDAADDATRELDPLARTQETPTIESPMLEGRRAEREAPTVESPALGVDAGADQDSDSDTVRERRSAALKVSADQTAELSIDDLGLDVSAIHQPGALEDTTSIEKDEDDEVATLGDDELTQLAPSLGAFDRTMEAPRPQGFGEPEPQDEKFDSESTGTIYLDQVDLAGGDTVEQPRLGTAASVANHSSGDTVEQPRPDMRAAAAGDALGAHDVDATASMKLDPAALDFDLSQDLSDDDQGALERRKADEDSFSMDVFSDRTTQSPRIDLDVGEALFNDDSAPTDRTAAMELSELEPVTMSEVGTKLDLARAYMDMGDPDGARSILEEVLAEGNTGQQQEARRLIESIR